MIRKKNIIYGNFLESLKYVRESRKSIYFAIGLFFLIFLFGLLIPTPISFDKYIQEILKQIIDKTAGLSALELIGFILWNNFVVSAVGILFGIIFGFVPFLLCISNGYVLGYVFRTLIEKMGFFEGCSYFWRIIPHGIFELPAIMISLGIGLRLGSILFQNLNKNSFKDLKSEFKKSIKTLFLIILPLLVIAAIIESVLIKFLG